jgi:hypothetical protein
MHEFRKAIGLLLAHPVLVDGAKVSEIGNITINEQWISPSTDAFRLLVVGIVPHVLQFGMGIGREPVVL